MDTLVTTYPDGTVVTETITEAPAPEPSPDLPPGVLRIDVIDAQRVRVLREGNEVGGEAAIVWASLPGQGKPADIEHHKRAIDIQRGIFADESIYTFNEPAEDGQDVTIKFFKGHTYTYTQGEAVAEAIRVTQGGFSGDIHFNVSFNGANYWGEDSEEVALLFDADTGERADPVAHLWRRQGADRPQKTKQGQLIFGNDIPVQGLFTDVPPGRYFIWHGNVGRSRTFTVGPHAWGPAYYITARHAMYQLIGTAASEPYSHHEYPASSHGPVYEGQQQAALLGDGLALATEPGKPDKPRRGIDIAKWDTSEENPKRKVYWDGLRWHRDDADGDFQWAIRRNIPILIAFLETPEKFTKGQLQIDNPTEMPDVLHLQDEWLDEWARAGMTKGFRAARVETTIHRVEYSDPQHEIAWSTGPLDRASGFQWASIMGLMSMCCDAVAHHDGAEFYRRAAVAAFTQALDAEDRQPGDQITCIARQRSPHPDNPEEWVERGDKYTWTYPQEAYEQRLKDTVPYEIQARSVMWMLGHDEQQVHRDIIQVLSKTAPDITRSPYRIGDGAEWFYYIAQKHMGMNFQTYTDTADKLIRTIDGNDYPTTYKSGSISFGKHSCEGASFLLATYGLTGDEKYKRYAERLLHFVTGENPLGICYISGLGEKCFAILQHGMEVDKELQPTPPGDMGYGPNPEGYRGAALKHGLQDPAEIGMYQMWPPSLKGIAICNEGPYNHAQIMSSLMWFVEPGWMPDADTMPKVVAVEDIPKQAGAAPA